MRMHSERERYYLLPGMGGRARRRKVVAMTGWGLVGGLLASGLMVLMLYLLNQIGSGR